MSRRFTAVVILVAAIAILGIVSRWMDDAIAAQRLTATLGQASPRWVQARAHAWLPQGRERVWESAGWFTDILSAERASRQSHRPMLLVCVTGDLATGHC